MVEGKMCDMLNHEKEYGDYILDVTSRLLAVDSPSGLTAKAARFVQDELKSLGYASALTRKGSVTACLGGEEKGDGLLLEAHMDTLGAMVAEIKDNGRLRLTPIGGMNANNAEGENCRIVTKFDGTYEGTFQLVNASIHVNVDYNTIYRT